MLTEEQRIIRAKKGAEERWNPSVPKATHSGVLIIAGNEIQCDVLSDGRRILRRATILRVMGRGKIGGKQTRRATAVNLPIFAHSDNLTPYLGDDFATVALPVVYRGVDNKKLTGYLATILPEICKAYVKAEDDNKLKVAQEKVAKTCRSIIYGLATVGIIALVDDATGYVYQRERDELQLILEKYIAKELMPWTKRFPDEFFEQVYRIHGWKWPKVHKNHPQCVGKFIDTYVYKALPEGVLNELKAKNPTNENGNRKNRHHQWLSESIGEKNLDKQLVRVITLMKVSDTTEDFRKLCEKI